MLKVKLIFDILFSGDRYKRLRNTKDIRCAREKVDHLERVIFEAFSVEKFDQAWKQVREKHNREVF